LKTTKNTYNTLSYENGSIYFSGKEVLLIRGWGRLTGGGGLNLPHEVAAKLQDDFGNWIVNVLNN